MLIILAELYEVHHKFETSVNNVICITPYYKPFLLENIGRWKFYTCTHAVATCYILLFWMRWYIAADDRFNTVYEQLWWKLLNLKCFSGKKNFYFIIAIWYGGGSEWYLPSIKDENIFCKSMYKNTNNRIVWYCFLNNNLWI